MLVLVLVLVLELLLLLLVELQPVVAPLVESKRAGGCKRKKNLCPRLNFLKLILSREKVINILNINDRAY